MSKILRGESPLQVPPELAAWVGLNEALLLQQLHYWLENDNVIGRTEDGAKWIRNSVREWGENFPFWDHMTIFRTIANLESDGLIRSRTFTGRCKWYTVDYAKVDDLTGPVGRIAGKSMARSKANQSRPAEPVETPDINEGITTKCGDTEVEVLPQIVTSITTKCGDVSPQNVVLQRLSKRLPETNGIGDKPPSTNGTGNTRNIALGELSNEFIAYTGIPLPSGKQDRRYWYSRLGELYEIAKRDIDIGKRLIRESVDKLRADDLTISDPGSLVKTARAIMAKKNQPKQKVRL